jgi:hypothetical protein
VFLDSSCQDFADWKAAQPEELEADRPSEEELADYALAEKVSKAQVRKLSKIKNPILFYILTLVQV